MARRTHANAALVTGGAKRIGKAIAVKLAELGYHIALHYHGSVSEADKTARQICSKGVKCKTFACDLSKEKPVSELIKRVRKTFPELNLLVNNASIFQKSKLSSTSLEQFDRNFHIHCYAPFVLIRDFAQQCREGGIINLLDAQITTNKTEYFNYLLSKKTLAELTKMAALDLAPRIRVNAIAPGFILPATGIKASSSKRLATVPLKRQGEIRHITDSVEFLIKNDYLTGQILFNGGGEHLR